MPCAVCGDAVKVGLFFRPFHHLGALNGRRPLRPIRLVEVVDRDADGDADGVCLGSVVIVPGNIVVAGVIIVSTGGADGITTRAYHSGAQQPNKRRQGASRVCDVSFHVKSYLKASTNFTNRQSVNPIYPHSVHRPFHKKTNQNKQNFDTPPAL